MSGPIENTPTGDVSPNISGENVKKGIGIAATVLIVAAIVGFFIWWLNGKDEESSDASGALKRAARRKSARAAAAAAAAAEIQFPELADDATISEKGINTTIPLYYIDLHNYILEVHNTTGETEPNTRLNMGYVFMEIADLPRKYTSYAYVAQPSKFCVKDYREEPAYGVTTQKVYLPPVMNCSSSLPDTDYLEDGMRVYGVDYNNTQNASRASDPYGGYGDIYKTGNYTGLELTPGSASAKLVPIVKLAGKRTEVNALMENAGVRSLFQVDVFNLPLNFSLVTEIDDKTGDESEFSTNRQYGGENIPISMDFRPASTGRPATHNWSNFDPEQTYVRPNGNGTPEHRIVNKERAVDLVRVGDDYGYSPTLWNLYSAPEYFLDQYTIVQIAGKTYARVKLERWELLRSMIKLRNEYVICKAQQERPEDEIFSRVIVCDVAR